MEAPHGDSRNMSSKSKNPDESSMDTQEPIRHESSRFSLVSITVTSEKLDEKIAISDHERSAFSDSLASSLQILAEKEFSYAKNRADEYVTKSMAGSYIVGLVFKNQNDHSQIVSFINLDENKDIIIISVKDASTKTTIHGYLKKRIMDLEETRLHKSHD
jgi:hypothetical protein